MLLCASKRRLNDIQTSWLTEQYVFVTTIPVYCHSMLVASAHSHVGNVIVVLRGI